MEKTKFRQNLQTEDLIAFNFYLVDRKSKSSIFPRLLGLFIFILGCIDISKEGASIPMCLLTMAIGVFGMLGLVPLSSLMQKRTIRKKLTEANQIVPMDVTVYEEGIRFELPQPDAEEEQPVEEETQEENQELSDNELRELEYAEDAQESETEDTEEAQTEEEQLDEPVVAKLEGEKQFNALSHSDANPTNAFTIPWGGMSNVEETNEYLFVNVAGYQTMIIRKDACDNIEEVISYIKENLKDKRRYTYNIKKEQ